ncbi:MAG TPA: CoB--CoM heterodisulfide reductase iron-sulfur subunit B family protein [Planctomycetota bacterium]|nr:CoB--CoM heterodisulfide reductase iron-sulfur subunit B family protein [Planctomycetota bacterium]HRR82166.1 CoB--CoM heterodisulfide reductase iron-sulfur subunit B family protein [Planctomycetota bacterium]
MKYGYFPGCSLLSGAAEYDRSARGVLAALGVAVEEIEDWVCCGATPAHATNHLLSVALPAISCAAAEKQGLDILTCCSACYSRLKQANAELQADPALLAKVNGIIEEDYKGGIRVLHIAEILAREVGLDALRARVTRPLKGLKVASYYGCLLARLPEELRIDKIEYPTLLDDLMAATGAEPVDWPCKTECCGAALTLAMQDTVVRLSGGILQAARDAGADALVVACPLCQANLDLFQSNAEAQFGEAFGLPVLYFTQMLGLALGLEAGDLCLDKVIVDPMPLLAEKGLVETAVYL